MNPEQKKLLSQHLDKSAVKEREQGGRKLSYIEGWHAIAEANRIFDFDGWQRETVYCKEVCRYEIEKKNSTGKNWKVGYEAKVKIIVGDIVREGTGHGNGTMGDLYDAIESAAKEAETDAMKRALMTFGNPFGLALYDKTQANVSSTPRTITDEQKKSFIQDIENAQTQEDVTKEYSKAAKVADEIGNEILKEEFKKAALDRKATLKSYQQAAE